MSAFTRVRALSTLAAAAAATAAAVWFVRRRGAVRTTPRTAPPPSWSCFLLSPSFEAEEADAPILIADRGFVARERSAGRLDRLIETAGGWLESAGVSADEIDAEAANLAEHVEAWRREGRDFDRIFVRDAERAFRSAERQEAMMHVLTIMQNRLGDYHQGLGLVAAFLLLTLDSPRVLALLTRAATDERYVPEIWRAESIASATDGYVLWDLAEREVPAARAALARHRVLPETLVQKWFCALSVHVLPFEALFPFFTRFFSEGRLALFRLGLSILDRFQIALGEVGEQYEVYELLRLDFDAQPERVTDGAAADIVSAEALDAYDLDGFAPQLPGLREAAFDKHLRARIEAANASLQRNTDMQKCQFCGDVDSDDFCTVCEKLICDDCRDANAGEHDEDEHPVRSLGEDDDDEEE